MLNAGEVVDTYYLDVRCMLLEIAATLDRLDRANAADDGSNLVGGSSDRHADERIEQIYESLELLAVRAATPDRSERLLNLFSD